MAFADSLCRKPGTLIKTMLQQRLNWILWTGRIKSAGLPQKGGQILLVQYNAGNAYICQHDKLPESIQGIGQFPYDIRIIQPRSTRFGDYIIIRMVEKSFVQPVKLPYQPLASISCDGVSTFPARGDTQSRGYPAILPSDNDEMCRPHLFPEAGEFQELLSFPKPFGLGEGLKSHQVLFGRDCDGQSLPSLGPPSFDNKTPVFGRHADKKSMRSFTRSIAWLKCPFHIPLTPRS